MVMGAKRQGKGGGEQTTFGNRIVAKPRVGIYYNINLSHSTRNWDIFQLHYYFTFLEQLNVKYKNQKYYIYVLKFNKPQ